MNKREQYLFEEKLDLLEEYKIMSYRFDLFLTQEADGIIHVNNEEFELICDTYQLCEEALIYLLQAPSIETLIVKNDEYEGLFADFFDMMTYFIEEEEEEEEEDFFSLAQTEDVSNEEEDTDAITFFIGLLKYLREE